MIGLVSWGERLNNAKKTNKSPDGNVEALANTTPKAATGRNSTPLHHAFIRSLILGTEPEGYISLCNAIATAKPPQYSNIKVPLLIIAGSDDQTAPRSGCELILKGYGTRDEEKRIVELDGVGHWHVIEDYEKVGGLIVDFVNGTVDA